MQLKHTLTDNAFTHTQHRHKHLPIQVQFVTILRQLCKWQSSGERPTKLKGETRERERERETANERAQDRERERTKANERAKCRAVRESAHNAAYT